MRIANKMAVVLLCLLFAFGSLLTGCATDVSDSEATTESIVSLQYNGDAEAEDDSQNTEVIDDSWNDVQITTNDIGYSPDEELLDEDGYYTSEEDVATYLVEYQTLPENFITKKEARKLGWNGGGLDDYAEGCCIGGDRFGNNEGLLPEVDGRTYYECDIDTMNANKRGAKRIIYSDDGQIYYTDDHYESFTLIYGTDE